MRRRSWLKLFTISFILVVIAVFAIDSWVSKSTREQLYTDLVSIPHNKVGLLLGTNKLAHGYENLYYRYRINAAVELFKAGKIDYILISGDNSRKEYNEPEDMQQSLIDAGIPAERIVLDFAGFRTLDSILRCLGVFGEDNITVISQRFHNERAVFIANRKNIHAIAYNAQDVPKRWSWKVMLREKFARVKMLLDIMFNKQPHFYGPKIEIDAEKNGEYPLKDFKTKELLRLSTGDTTQTFLLFQFPLLSILSPASEDVVGKWISEHPNAKVKVLFTYTLPDDSSKSKFHYCCVVAGRDTLNTELVKNGCVAEMLVPSHGFERDNIKYYVDKKDIGKFEKQISTAYQYARTNKRGVWRE